MTGRERIQTALSHCEPDRIPRDLGGTESSGLTALAHVTLSRHLGMAHTPKVFEPFQYVSYVDNPTHKRFGIDTGNLTPEPTNWSERVHPNGFEVLLPEQWHEDRSPDGSTVVRRADGTAAARRPAGGFYFDPVNPPLAGVSDAGSLQAHRATVTSFDWPFFVDEGLQQLQDRARLLHESGTCVVFNLCCHLLAAGQLLRGYENFMVDLALNPTFAEALLDMLVLGYAERVDRLAPVLRELVDVVLLNDDLGTQQGPMLSPSLYRQLVKPHQKRLFAHVKRAFDAPILFHSCGSVREFIPDLVEVGVDALNPVQLSAAGMAPSTLKAEFGDVLTFWGGGVDTQTVLNRDTPAEVRDAVRRNADVLGPGGGFVFCQVHNIQPDVPPENVVAMFEALDDLA